MGSSYLVIFQLSEIETNESFPKGQDSNIQKSPSILVTKVLPDTGSEKMHYLYFQQA